MNDNELEDIARGNIAPEFGIVNGRDRMQLQLQALTIVEQRKQTKLLEYIKLQVDQHTVREDLRK